MFLQPTLLINGIKCLLKKSSIPTLQIQLIG